MQIKLTYGKDSAIFETPEEAASFLKSRYDLSSVKYREVVRVLNLLLGWKLESGYNLKLPVDP